MRDGVVDEDRDQLAEPQRRRRRPRPAADRRRSVTPRSAAIAVSGPTASTATSARSTGARSSSIVPASVRARSSRSSTRAVRWVVSASMSSSAAPTWRDRLVLVAPQVGDAGPDHGERRAQLVAGVGGELALAPQGRLAPVDRGADRHERPAGVDPAGRDGEGQRGEAAEHEDGEERGEEPLLRDPLADHLDHPLAVAARHGQGVDPDRRLVERRRARVRRRRLAGGRDATARWGGPSTSSRRPRTEPSGWIASVSVPDCSPPKANPNGGRSGDRPGPADDPRRPRRHGSRGRPCPGWRARWRRPRRRARPSARRMSSVRPPLQAMRRSRVRRRSAASSPAASLPRAAGVGASGSASTDAVPDAADGLDPGAAVGAELRAQQVDVGLDRVGRERRAVRPGLVEELVAREDLAGPAEEALQDGVLALAQVDRRAARRSPAGRSRRGRSARP